MFRLRYTLPILVAVGFILFFPVLPNQFVWDDEEQVVANTAVHSLSELPSIFAGSTFNSGGSERLGGLYYKPLMSASFAVIYTIFGPSPWAFHLFQIALHIGATLLLYLILKALWRTEWGAFGAALLFLVHPQNVETVVYISSLQDTLYMFFGMLGLTWMVRGSERIRWVDVGIVSLCAFLAMLGKETGVIFVVIIALYLAIFRGKAALKKWVAGVLVVLGVYLFMRIGLAQVGLEKNMFTPMATLPLLTRLGNIPRIVWHYLSQFVWPAKLSISQHWVNSSPGILEWVALLVMIAGWLALLWKQWINNNRVFVFFWVWLGIALAFHSQIFPLDMTVADRWFYLPMIGLIGSVGSIKAIRINKGVMMVAIVVTLAMMARSAVRIQDWRDGLTLYQHDQAIMPNSFDLENNLGVELYRVGRISQARAHFAKSTEIAPNWWTNWNNLGVIVEAEGDLDLALSYYQKAIDNGGYYLAYGNYGRVLIKQERYAEAREFVKNSLQLYPANSTLLELNNYLERVK